ncbi:MAG TPA: DotI/IcmL/TraM family protein [Gammaproteobacteria bacterium]|jgi:intracellular multiplication protein IcmL|nr:DotI/IcmL/TraM family protein [Gammaproteobacteria bacterium]
MKEAYLPESNSFYSNHYHQFIAGLMILMVVIIVFGAVILYQLNHRPMPVFNAVLPTHEKRILTYFDEPNLLSDTILRWGSKAAATAYTFDFVNYDKQIALAQPYFTDAGWQDYLASVQKLIKTIVDNQLFVNGVVSGPPVIASEGPLPDVDYAWRVQIPFLVSFQSANSVYKRNYIVSLTIIRVPTTVNPQGIGIDRFVMS